MSTNNCIITFDGYSVDELIFRHNPEFIETDEPIELSPSISRTIEKTDDGKIFVHLLLCVDKNNKPFELHVELTGFFSISGENCSEDIVNNNTVAIMYPYLRSTVSFLTLNANVPPLVLPTINVAKKFEESRNKNQPDAE